MSADDDVWAFASRGCRLEGVADFVEGTLDNLYLNAVGLGELGNGLTQGRGAGVVRPDGQRGGILAENRDDKQAGNQRQNNQ